jgi:tRNA (uracil-5-)-methyltransferase
MTDSSETLQNDMSSSEADGNDDFLLPGYEAGPNDSGVKHSIGKLEQAGRNLKPHLPLHLAIESQPCEEEAQSWGYRCNCTFQIVRDETSRTFHYAMRHKGTPIRLGTSFFLIANRRIQAAMRGLMDDVLNHSSYAQSAISRGLTSLTFASSWNDASTSDCIVTLLYGEPLDEQEWKAEAESVCKTLNLRQMHGRSKKCLLSVLDPEFSTLRDSLFLDKSTYSINLSSECNKGTNDVVQVKYEKPDNAFYHPNAHAMKEALQWMLERLSSIQQELGSCRLLEMYCGCGAHTVALAKSGMLQEILAIELDHRLIQACIRNVALNELQSTIQVAQGDAGMWAKRFYKNSSKNYNILLVDPPRAGLDQDVCNMAKQGSFNHFLYISCGHKALLRDLERLSDVFEVIHCRQLDLFPRTDSIETLVHLRRKE